MPATTLSENETLSETTTFPEADAAAEPVTPETGSRVLRLVRAPEDPVRKRPAARPQARSTDLDRATSVDKALAVLEAFGESGTVLGVTEVARRTGLTKSTVHRMLGVLRERGYLKRDGVEYVLTPMLLELGNGVEHADHRQLRSAAMPHMIELLQATGAAVHLSALVGPDILILERVFGHGGVRGIPDPGTRFPAAGTAPGDAIRAFSGAPPRSAEDARRLLEARRRRVAHQGWGPDGNVVCMSVPVRTSSAGEVAAALSLVVRRDPRRPLDSGSALLAAAARIGGVL